jgi:hypothetical protein
VIPRGPESGRQFKSHGVAPVGRVSCAGRVRSHGGIDSGRPDFGRAARSDRGGRFSHRASRPSAALVYRLVLLVRSSDEISYNDRQCSRRASMRRVCLATSTSLVNARPTPAFCLRRYSRLGLIPDISSSDRGRPDRPPPNADFKGRDARRAFPGSRRDAPSRPPTVGRVRSPLARNAPLRRPRRSARNRLDRWTVRARPPAA